MKRRAFITLLSGAMAVWPLAARAQQPTMPVVGLLSSGSPNALADFVPAFHSGLNEAGYVEHRNVGIDYRWAEGQYDRLPALAANLVDRQVSVIATFGGIPGARAANAATTTIPIVFWIGADPVAFGLVASLNKPGGNLTGVTSLGDELGPKRIELIRELIPRATVIAALINPTSPVAETQSRQMQAAARAFGLQLHVLHASAERDFDKVFATVTELRADALLIGPDAFFSQARANSSPH